MSLYDWLSRSDRQLQISATLNAPLVALRYKSNIHFWYGTSDRHNTPETQPNKEIANTLDDTIRDRLDEVCPDWIIDYSEIQYLGNDAICRCGITILGVRKRRYLR
ncbi:MAG: hypothetical protein DSM106950_30135 [Stigonema ocellatum SAG 48.90 = DSM 106950]|nr:hypothetical protein [Stigonema ocellatum SAG 48.90 = DSM 106950]